MYYHMPDSGIFSKFYHFRAKKEQGTTPEKTSIVFASWSFSFQERETQRERDRERERAKNFHFFSISTEEVETFCSLRLPLSVSLSLSLSLTVQKRQTFFLFFMAFLKIWNTFSSSARHTLPRSSYVSWFCPFKVLSCLFHSHHPPLPLGTKMLMPAIKFEQSTVGGVRVPCIYLQARQELQWVIRGPWCWVPATVFWA